MIDRDALKADLIKQVKAVETDLGKQVKAREDVGSRLRAEYDRAWKLGRTGTTWNSWLDERITQAAAAWVLGTVFVRFCEDNGLIPEPYLAGPSVERQDVALERYHAYLDEDDDPTFRGWLEHAFDELGSGQAGKLLFDQRHNALYQIPLSHDGARELVEFWRERDQTGALVHDFTDPLSDDGTEGWDTRFLGDLYQDLSEAARKTYALLQTPEFVEEFILDRAMDPAVREFGYAELKMIDPTCGSGHFVLGAFRRLVRLWGDRQPGRDLHERIRAALDSVHGVDINPFAVAIARFRLLVAAMAASGVHTLADAGRYDWPIHLAVGDSLIKSRQLELTLIGEESGDELAEFAYATEDVHEHPRILEEGRYHVVVGNPPYITVKDKRLNALYRELYKACAGKYALSVPFAQRFFELAKAGHADGHGYGRVGQITSNSFMKREFGTKLIEEYFAHKAELTEVIDTSGAYIPGHGTPTVILVGRPRSGSNRQTTIRTVRSVQGEPGAPKEGENGYVWQAIVDQISKPTSTSRWISVDDLSRDKFFRKQPWILADRGLELVEKVAEFSDKTLSQIAKSVGIVSFTLEDDLYILPPKSASRHNLPNEYRRSMVTGDLLRDWSGGEFEEAVFPYSPNFEPVTVEEVRSLHTYMWPCRTTLSRNIMFGGKSKVASGLAWSEYGRLTSHKLKHPLSITFAEVATHNHFVLDRGGHIFKQTAPIIKLRDATSTEEHLGIIGVLNSSTACMWLKMMCHNKGSTVDSKGARQATRPFEDFYQFNGTNVSEFPLPNDYPVALAAEIDSLAHALATDWTTSSPSAATCRESEETWRFTRARMIALQEELDWQTYSLYRLHPEDLRVPEADVPELAVGERAFEIVLARRVEEGEASGEWFERHGSTPITEVPSHWPESYKAIVEKRIDAIESSRAIGMIEVTVLDDPRPAAMPC